ncbi:site-2 protease family protein [Sphingomonas endophytica]|uniref:Peptidase M48 n=1 Tax=Sphingomonas endophytica TaxID=869719 RepID=A0A147I053_9SPHN|nr:site-2 protease family protein [Sphingomonas endophytica]KTT70663.1 peptidase M48 [Sphingomonas endophytica]
MNPNSVIWSAAIWIIPLVIAIVFHEVAHGLAARALGDPTAEEQRRLSFNPLRHVDPIGTVALPLLLALAKAPMFGWAKPVPVDAGRLPNPRRDMMLVALAGPASNLALALVGAILLGLFTRDIYGVAPGTVSAFVAANLLNFVIINVFLALFNLIPLPPFDGGHVVAGLLPERLAQRWDGLARFGFPLLILLLLVLPSLVPGANIVQRLVAPPAQAVAEWYLSLAGAIGG